MHTQKNRMTYERSESRTRHFDQQLSISNILKANQHPNHNARKQFNLVEQKRLQTQNQTIYYQQTSNLSTKLQLKFKFFLFKR